MDIDNRKRDLDLHLQLKRNSGETHLMGISVFLGFSFFPICAYLILSYFEFSNVTSAFFGLIILIISMFVRILINRTHQLELAAAMYESLWIQTEAMLDKLNGTHKP